MKKALIFSLASIFLLCTAGLAQAKEFKGGKMSVQIPDSWEAGYTANINQIQMTSPNKSFAMAVQILPDPGKGAKELSTEASSKLGGTSPKRVGSNENHYFFFAPLNKENASKKSSDIMMVNVFLTNAKAVTIVEAGNGKPYRKETSQILKSFQSSDPGEQAALEAVIKE